MFMGLVALVADIGYAYAERQRIQGMIDMAGMTTLLTIAQITPTNAEASVDTILTANSVDPSIIESVTLVQDNQGRNLTIDAQLPIGAMFGQLFNFTTYSTDVQSMTTAVRAPLPQPELSGFGLFSCTDLTINNDMGSYDSAVGPNHGPPAGFPTITSCTGGGTNCNDELLIGANGDVFFHGATVYGNVVAGGSVIITDPTTDNRVTGQVRVGTDTSEVLGNDGTQYNEPFTDPGCSEGSKFPDHFLEDSTEAATHDHPHPSVAMKTLTFTRKREIESNVIGNDSDGDGETDGYGLPDSSTGTCCITDGFTVTTIRGDREYTLGNRITEQDDTDDGLGAVAGTIDNSTAATEEDILFHNSPTHGTFNTPTDCTAIASTSSGFGNLSEDCNLGSSTFGWAMDITLADELGGWIWDASGTQDDAHFHTGVAYFFHEIHLNGKRGARFHGDWEIDGPSIWFIHGNGEGVINDDDFKGNNAEFSYEGTCNGSACGSATDVPGLRIYATDGTKLDMAGNYKMAVDVTAPDAEVDMTGTSGVLGRVIAGSITMGGNASFQFDEQLQEGDINQPFIPDGADFARIVW
jgi:hypothetical protein